MGPPTLLGQSHVSLSEHNLWHEAPRYSLTLPMGPADHQVIGPKGKVIKLGDDEVSGSITIEFHPQNSAVHMACWCEQYTHSKAYLTKNKDHWTRKWIVLGPHGIHIFQEPRKGNPNQNSVDLNGVHEDTNLPLADIDEERFVDDFQGKRTPVLEIHRHDDKHPLWIWFETPHESVLFHLKYVAARNLLAEEDCKPPSGKMSSWVVEH